MMNELQTRSKTGYHGGNEVKNEPSPRFLKNTLPSPVLHTCGQVAAPAASQVRETFRFCACGDAAKSSALAVHHLVHHYNVASAPSAPVVKTSQVRVHQISAASTPLQIYNSIR